MIGSRVLSALAGGLALLGLAACSMGDFSIGSRRLSWPGGPEQPEAVTSQAVMPVAAQETFGRGSVKVALLLPLTGELAGTGVALANAAKLAMGFIEANPNIAENISVTLRDTGGSVAGATQAASAAVADGASLILGPLVGEQVRAAGAVARQAGIPLIGFAKNSGVAAPGVYLLSVLPETELKRSFGYLLAQDHRGFAAAFPATEYGAAQEKAFRQAVAATGLSPVAIYTYGSAAEAQGILQQALPMLKNGYIDTLFLPDRATAPDFGAVLQQAGVSGLQVLGSADWEGDARIAQAPGLNGAIYPAVDPAGLMAISGDYQARFGGPPPALATLAYTAVILANVKTLSMSSPRYDAAALTTQSGFNGRDGVFRFMADGRSEYALAIKQVGAGGTSVVEGPRI